MIEGLSTLPTSPWMCSRCGEILPNDEWKHDKSKPLCVFCYFPETTGLCIACKARPCVKELWDLCIPCDLEKHKEVEEWNEKHGVF